MLKTIPPVLGPDLLWAIAAMGHGDRLVIADRNYPAHSGPSRTLEALGVDTTTFIESLLQLFPVDDFVSPEAFAMVPDEGAEEAYESHQSAAQLISRAEGRPVELARVPRTRFYDLARSSFATVITSDARPYSCFMLVKGVVRT
ncbi:RbsD/FucU domain-containing protein [Pseudarthrobacter sp. WHRI 8279]|uniref:RbsD/FucU family protein n=1 Tax=Pseudarthrobacter sp. WHRI 8279 TaxID=3162566 RepID=UPI0032EB336B